MKKIIFFYLLLGTASTTKAQEFTNGDLSGITPCAIGTLPANWLNVPYTDVNSIASANSAYATCDLTYLGGPAAGSGINGNPYSGGTFVSALLMSSGSTWDEGLMQTVSGFIIGNTYSINFHQAVVKQFNCLDSSGSWAVYIDTTLAGISAPTFSPAAYNSTSFIWELRTVYFTATSTSHIIKFLPQDDDASIVAPAGLRMGIDCIYITTPCGNACNLTSPTIIQTGDTLAVPPIYANYQWFHDSIPISGATQNYYVTTASGNYNIIVTDSDSCSVGAGILNVISSIESINNVNESVLFPNPFTNSVRVNVIDNTQSQIIIYDMLSRKLLQKTFTNSTTLNTEQLAKGIYIYEVRNKNGVVQNGKVVKE